ncbi:putative glycosyltransferase STELLO1 [Nymphon striatum]|nr:putative glycosyltransferase STELLO1 [Nymphon striatum]
MGILGRENNKVEKKCIVDPNMLHDKWIILTSINPVTEDVKKLAKIPGYQVLVVGDTKTPENYSFPGVIYLNLETQYSLDYNILKFTPENNYARKNIGFLYAIQHGAKLIYETDDDNAPWPDLNLNSFYTDDSITSLVVNTHGAYNPLAHFGQPSMWPRGHPLEKITTGIPRDYHIEKTSRPAIQQGLVNGDPDVDALFRLTRKLKDSNLNVTFDSTTPPVILSEGALTSYNSQNTMTSYNGFWSLLLPSYISIRVSDIWRGYCAQRLMWLVGERLMYLPPNAYQFRNGHDYIKDMILEYQLYEEAGQYVDFLLNWNCSETDILSCFISLGKDLAAEKFIQIENSHLIDAWVQDLDNICYEPPQLKRSEGQVLSDKIKYFPNDQKSSYPQADDYDVLNSESKLFQAVDYVKEICPQFTASRFDKNHEAKMADVLLVIFNRYLDASSVIKFSKIYQIHFPNQILCSIRNIDKKIIDAEGLSYIDIDKYVPSDNALKACLRDVSMMNYNLDGFIVIEDKILLNPSNITMFNRNAVWTSLDLQPYETDLLDRSKKNNIDEDIDKPFANGRTSLPVFYVPKRLWRTLSNSLDKLLLMPTIGTSLKTFIADFEDERNHVHMSSSAFKKVTAGSDNQIGIKELSFVHSVNINKVKILNSHIMDLLEQCSVEQVEQLRVKLRQLDLPVSGIREDLIRRIREAESIPEDRLAKQTNKRKFELHQMVIGEKALGVSWNVQEDSLGFKYEPQILKIKSGGDYSQIKLTDKDDLYTKRRWKRVQYLAQVFWSRRKKGYLLAQQLRQNFQLQDAILRLVILFLYHQEDLPRNKWPLAIITSVMPIAHINAH